nr:immunoglobulin light chain junction region [Macaca mulatta]MOV77674.1 immunoglobulin light chain junction region [Macaca mulatta]MOV77695.1 immunoglobulin light chain junction region [Macaca mulatta]MOV77740.1 immunoglobulin light chain junction region [Macaca mulatta]MOV77748.1 immunoglobulin light chain junction region [Macaca mulatta]
CQQHDDSPRTF